MDSLEQIEVQDMMELQNNNLSIKAEEALPIMLKHLDHSKLDASQKKYVEILSQWDFNYDANAAAPILFDNWFDQFYFNIWDEVRMIDDSIDIIYPETWRTIALMENDPENIFFDIQATNEKRNFTGINAIIFHIDAC